MDKIEQKRQFIIQCMYWGIWILLGIFAIRYLLPVLFPFIIAFGVACLLSKPIGYVTKKVKGHRKFISIVTLLLFLCCSSVLISFICSGLFRGIEGIMTLLPRIFHEFIIPWIEQTLDSLDGMFLNMEFSLFDLFEENAVVILDHLSQAVTHFSNGVLSSLGNMISQIPTLFMQTIITIIAMFFITLDYENCVSYLKAHIPEGKKSILREANRFFIHTIPKFGLFYGIILCLTGIELFFGFTILQIPHAGVLAILIAILDILPVLGTGTILIPWAILNLITGEVPLGIGLFLLYLIITVIRNSIEPKLIGKQMGLHPVITLASMLVGMKFFGVWGLFGLPIGISFLKRIQSKEELEEKNGMKCHVG